MVDNGKKGNRDLFDNMLSIKLLVLSLLKKGEKNMRNLRKLEKGEENYEKNVVQQAF